MAKRPAKTSNDKLSFLVESAASLRNLYLKEVSVDQGRRVWKLTAGASISTEIAALGSNSSMVCVATPIVSMGEYEIYMPTAIKIEAGIDIISEWITPAIVDSLERADTLLEILTSLGEAVKATGYTGKLKSLPPVQKNNELFFPVLISEQHGGKMFTTEICIGVHKRDFSCSMKTKVMNAKESLIEKDVAMSSNTAEILEAVADAIDISREQYSIVKKEVAVSEAYATLLNDPLAYDGRVVIMVPRQKMASKPAQDK